MQLTPSQRKALDLHRHLAIVANAGSGKTRVLVQRYVDILERFEHIKPRNVVAITFTEAAAAELRTRVAREIERRIEDMGKELSAQDDTPDRDLLRRHRALKASRDSLASAVIGTIHSFCSRLLRAYPVEANVDATFAQLSGPDQSLALEDAIASVFYDILQRAYSEEPDEFSTQARKTFRVFGRSTVTELVRSLFQNRSRVDLLNRQLLSLSDDEIVERWTETLEMLVSPILSTTKHFERLLANGKGKYKLDGEQSLALFSSASSFYERVAAFRKLYDACFTQKAELRKALIGDTEKLAVVESDINSILGVVTSVASILPLVPADAATFRKKHLDYISHLRTVFELFERVRQIYSESKISHSLLDFDDLIERTIELTENPSLQQELSERFPFIMIDEYQDTDDSQFRIAKALSSDFNGTNKLTIVGDPKQSIYSFRNAEGRVFSETVDTIVTQELSNQALLASIEGRFSPEEEQVRIALSESFRMAERPLAFINALFERVMATEPNVFANERVNYDPLVCGRVTEMKGSVELLISASTAPNSDDEAGSGDLASDENITPEEDGEADLIASKIIRIVSSGLDYAVEDAGGIREPRYSDIAILLRSRTHLPDLEQVLRRHNVPYVVTKGAGFYGQQEILDIVSYLRFLLSASDDISLTAILRSPFFTISDTELFQISVNTRRERDELIPERPLSLWERLERYVQKYDHSERLDSAVLQLRNNQLLVGRIGTAQLIEKIFAESAIIAILSAAPHGYQKVANLRKFHTIARQSDQSGFSTFYDFVERINYLVESDSAEAQADAQPGHDAVQIMTVHGAKGLEYPIVIAGFLNQKFNFDNVRVLDRELGLLLSYPDTEASDKPAIAEIIRLRARENTRNEEKRILYVALTRARDHLILSSTADKIQKDSYIAWIIEALGPSALTAQSLHFSHEITRYTGDNADPYKSELLGFEIPITHNQAGANDTPAMAPEQISTAFPASYLQPIPQLHRVDRFSATQFLTYKQCATKYHLAYGLGIPQEPKLAYDMEADEYSERVKGMLAGQVIHRVLQHIDQLVKERSVDPHRLDESVTGICESLGIVEPADVRKYLARTSRDVEHFVASSEGKSALEGVETRTEFPIQFGLSQDITFFGIIDRLYRDAETGIMTILDYKTELRAKATSKKAVTGSKSKRKSQYDFQLRFYAYLVHKMLPDVSVIHAIIFYTHTGESEKLIFTTEDFAGIERECLEMIEQIRMNEQVTSLEVLDRNTAHCPECSFYNGATKQCLVPVPDVTSPVLDLFAMA